MASSFAIGLFCEDVREEIAGTHTVVGIFPDNLSLTEMPATMPKLVLYLRFMLNPASEPGKIIVSLTFPSGETIDILTIDAEVTSAACKAAIEERMPHAGMFSKIIWAPFSVTHYGRLVATARIEGREEVCAILNFRKPTSSIAPEQPA